MGQGMDMACQGRGRDEEYQAAGWLSHRLVVQRPVQAWLDLKREDGCLKSGGVC